jgi:hypothetical protein
MPPATQNTIDLRLLTLPGNITFTALDALGNTLSSPVLDWSRIAVSTLYTTKNAYDAKCGAENTCSTMPACADVIGCDGFSVPAAILKQLLPANGYRITLAFRVNTIVAAQSRQLLQTTTEESDDVSFTIRFITNETISDNAFEPHYSVQEAFEKSGIALIVIGVLGYLGISQCAFKRNK